MRTSSLSPLFALTFIFTSAACSKTPGSQSSTSTSPEAVNSECPITYNLPGDIGVFGIDTPTQGNLDAYSWQMFLALNAPAVGASVSTTGDNRTLWGGAVGVPITSSVPGFSSTDDLLLGATSTSAPAYGTHYYPTECQAVPNYTSYRVVDELAKVDDDFFQAENGALSSNPVVASNGTFLRYEILISPITYQTIVNNQWYLTSVLSQQTAALNFPCGTASAGGSTACPATTGIGPITIKNAWMDATGLEASKYHMEDLLVYTSASQNSSGQATCALQTMALVGMHIAHKTNLQNGWTWSTFEHASNAPDCTANPPIKTHNNVPNQSCPAPDGTAYNFFPIKSGDARFASCNTVPATNASNIGPSPCNGDWCADQEPNPIGGFSQLCRQVPIAPSDSAYASAAQQTAACNQSTGSSVWSNYLLVSTQWFTALDSTTSCANASGTVSPGPSTITTYAPQVTLTGSVVQGTQNPVPYLANSSMESYERANCMGCHSNAVFTGANSASFSTDMMYFLMLEVPAAPVNSNGATASPQRLPAGFKLRSSRNAPTKPGR